MEDNKLIAEFMGFKLPDVNNPDSLYSKDIKRKGTTILDMSTGRRFHTMVDDKVLFDGDELMFHKSWDWLMTVVEKIETIERTVASITHNQCAIIDENYADLSKPKECREIRFEEIWEEGNTKLEATYKAVIEFIKWYNTNKNV